MLYSYASTPQEEAPKSAHAFLQATHLVSTTTGMVLGTTALASFMLDTNLDKEVTSLIAAVDGAESRKRVDVEIKRRLVTGKISGEVAEALKEAVEVLGMHKQDFSVADIPLIAVLYGNREFSEPPIVINITGVKALADAVRLVWSKNFLSPYPTTPLTVAVVIQRMPPATACARIQYVNNTFVIDASTGWGRLVGTAETGDRFVFDSHLQLQTKEVTEQRTMISRNERTGEIVQTAAPNGGAQKITDVQARSLCVDMKKLGLTEAVFGVNADKQWLLAITDTTPVSTDTQETVMDEPAMQETNVAEDAQTTEENGESEQTEELLAEDEEPRESDVEDELTTTEHTEEPIRAEPPLPDFSSQEPEHIDFSSQEASERQEDAAPSYTEQPSDEVVDTAEPETMHEDATDYDDDAHEPAAAASELEAGASASQKYQQTRQLMTAAVMQAYKTIEATLQEAAQDADAESFEELIEHVAKLRQIPYKQRLLSLSEMRKHAAFEDPDVDTVRFALETMERFIKEF